MSKVTLRGVSMRLWKLAKIECVEKDTTLGQIINEELSARYGLELKKNPQSKQA